MMDYRVSGFADKSVIKIQCENIENNVNDNLAVGSIDPIVSAAEQIRRNTKISFDTKSKSSHEGGLFQLEMESQHPNKRSRNSPLMCSMPYDRSNAMANIFYKTRLCEFTIDTCPFMNNCDYAHGIEELREPPINSEETVVVHEKEEQVEIAQANELLQMPSEGFVDEAWGPNMRHHCTKFLDGQSGQYGENCNYSHNENDKYRKSEAICLLPGNESKSNVNASNWKTRMCLKWEMNGWCPYDNKCHFAHGSEELRRYGGGRVNTEAGNSSTFDTKQIAIPAEASVGNVRRLPNVVLKSEEIPIRKWKCPNKISKIYGDWIDDL